MQLQFKIIKTIAHITHPPKIINKTLITQEIHKILTNKANHIIKQQNLRINVHKETNKEDKDNKCIAKDDKKENNKEEYQYEHN